MATKAADTITTFDLRIIDRTGVFHVHHTGPRESARERIRRMARYHYPKDEGYSYTGMGATSDCVTVFKAGKHHADVACEILEANDEPA